MVIAIEGMDGSGKTTIAKRLANNFNMTFYNFPNKHFMNMSDKSYDELCDKVYDSNEKIMAWFFGLGNMIQATSSKDKDVILDRHFLSNYFWNGSAVTESIFSALVDTAGKPDLTIVLYAGAKERMKRIYKRNNDDKDLSDPEKMIFGYDKMIAFARRYDLPFLVINTEDYDIDMTYKICSKLVERIKTMSKEDILDYCHRCNSRLYEKNNKPFSKYL